MKSKCGANEISGIALNNHEYMEQVHKEGAMVLMMIDSQMFENVVSYSYNDLLTKSYWIVYEGGLTFYDAANKPVEDIGKATKLVFKFAAWGNDSLKSSSLLKKWGYYLRVL